MSKSVTMLDNNPFAPIPADRLAEQLKPIEFEQTITEMVLVPYSTQVGDDPENIVIRYKPVKKNVYDINEYVASFADDVGIQNILKKLSLTGDKSILNQTGREALCPDGGLEPIQDYSGVPKNKTEAFNAVAAGVAAFDELPDDLKGKMSLTQFVQLFGQDEFDAYIKNLMVQQNPPTEGDK